MTAKSHRASMSRSTAVNRTRLHLYHGFLLRLSFLPLALVRGWVAVYAGMSTLLGSNSVRPDPARATLRVVAEFAPRDDTRYIPG